jgi:hypothetical protein
MFFAESLNFKLFNFVPFFPLRMSYQGVVFRIYFKQPVSIIMFIVNILKNLLLKVNKVNSSTKTTYTRDRIPIHKNNK